VCVRVWAGEGRVVSSVGAGGDVGGDKLSTSSITESK